MTAKATSKATPRSSPGLPTAVPPVTGDRAARPAAVVTSSRGPTVATPRICSAWDCRRCWPTRSRATCARSVTGRWRGQRWRALRCAYRLRSKDIEYGWLTVQPDGEVDPSEINGVDENLRVKPFFAEGSAFSIRQFVVGAFNNEMGLEAADPDLSTANGRRAGGHALRHGPRRLGRRFRSAAGLRPERGRRRRRRGRRGRCGARRLPGVLSPQLLPAGPLRTLPSSVTERTRRL